MNQEKVKKYEQVIRLVFSTHPDTKDLQGPIEDEQEWKQALINIKQKTMPYAVYESLHDSTAEE